MKSPMAITGGQLFWITSMFDLGMTAFMMVSPTIARVNNDAWISLIISTLLSMIATWIAIRLSRYYPDKTFIGYLNDIIGRGPGKVIGTIYVVNWIVVTSMVLRQITDMLITSQFHKTPNYVFVITMSATATYLLYKNGVQSIGRTTEVIGPLVLIIGLFTLFFDLPNVAWNRLLPIYVTSGPHALLYGAIPATSFMAQSSYITMILRFVENPRHSARKAVWGTGMAGLFLIGGSIFTVATFGVDLCKKIWNPILSMVQYISVGEIIQNIDAVILLIWFVTAFVRLSLFLFISVYGTAEVLSMQNWKSVLGWVTGACITISMLPRNMIESSVIYPQKIEQPFVLPVLVFAIPLALWFIAFLKNRNKAPNV